MNNINRGTGTDTFYDFFWGNQTQELQVKKEPRIEEASFNDFSNYIFDDLFSKVTNQPVQVENEPIGEASLHNSQNYTLNDLFFEVTNQRVQVENELIGEASLHNSQNYTLNDLFFEVTNQRVQVENEPIGEASLHDSQNYTLDDFLYGHTNQPVQVKKEPAIGEESYSEIEQEIEDRSDNILKLFQDQTLYNQINMENVIEEIRIGVISNPRLLNTPNLRKMMVYLKIKNQGLKKVLENKKMILQAAKIEEEITSFKKPKT
jgi:hypothetical protein